MNTCEYLDVKNNEFTNFLKRDVNGNLRLVKEKTLTNDDQQLDDSLNKMKIRDEEARKDDQLNNGDRKDSKLIAEFKKSKEPLIEVEGEKMDETNE